MVAAPPPPPPPPPPTQPHNSATTATAQEQELEEAERLERLQQLESQQTGFLHSHRTRSTELHGFSWVEEEPSAPEAGSSNAATATAPPQQQQQQQQHPLRSTSSNSTSSGGAAATTSSNFTADGRVNLSPAAPADMEQGGKPPAHGAGVRELLAPMGSRPGQDDPLTLSFSSLSVWAPVNPKKPSLLSRAWGKAASCGKAESNPQRQILFEVSGQVRPGEVLALMGPSGSSKTTLLTVLGGRSAMKYKGDVTVNGQPYTKATRKRIGFVLQDDVLFESLTVKETLAYAALLRLGAMTRKQKVERVETVMQALSLSKSKDTIIGGFFRRGISGGERKRVSIGTEMVINPSILLLDEPTSGLDSTTAMHLLSLLQDLAAGGRAIATTIHQPSSRLYQKLDWLMLLAEGHVMFYGKSDQVLDWFARFGYKIPFGVSVADFILDISLGEAGYSSSGNTGAAAIQELYTAYEQQYGGAAAAGNATTHAGGFSSGSSSSAAAASSSKPQPASASLSTQPQQRGSSHNKKQAAGRDRAPYWEQLRVLLQRAARVRRFEQMTGQHFFQLFAVAFITGLVWWQRGQDYYGGVQAASDILGLLFFMLLFPSMRSLFRALFTFPNEQRMLLKERPSGMYNLSAYYFARTLADVPAEMINTLLFVVIAYWFGGLRHDAGAFFGLLFSLVLVVLTAESWGLLIGGIFMDAKTAQTVTTVVILTFLLVGGYYVRNIPVWISWIKYLSFLFWGYNVLIKSQFNGVTFYECSGGGGAGSCSPVSIEQLSLSVQPSDPAYPDVLVLLGMLIGLRLVIYLVLRQKTKVVQRKMK